MQTFEPPHKKTNNLHVRKQRRRSAAKLISAFVVATRIVQFLYFLNPKFPVTSPLLCLYSTVCVGPVRKPHCWLSHEAARFALRVLLTFYDISQYTIYPAWCLGEDCMASQVHTNSRNLVSEKKSFCNHKPGLSHTNKVLRTYTRLLT